MGDGIIRTINNTVKQTKTVYILKGTHCMTQSYLGTDTFTFVYSFGM